jgi:hypothetical protein
MTSEIYPCAKCKDQREYLLDNDGVICTFIPCKCFLNRQPLTLTTTKVKTLDKAFRELDKQIGETNE